MLKAILDELTSSTDSKDAFHSQSCNLCDDYGADKINVMGVKNLPD